MNIKKVDDKPMVIHAKEKTKLHIKQEPETKIKSRNVLVVDKSPKIAGMDKEDKKVIKKSFRSLSHFLIRISRKKLPMMCLKWQL